MRKIIILLLALLMMPGSASAWIGYGFQSGMSRFKVAGRLADRESFVVTEGTAETFAGPPGSSAKFHLIYCASPQKLYLMKYRLADSLAEFDKAREKYEKRYGKPEVMVDRESADWEQVDITFIWHLNDSETILLTHRNNQTLAEFQDLSVCR